MIKLPAEHDGVGLGVGALVGLAVGANVGLHTRSDVDVAAITSRSAGEHFVSGAHSRSDTGVAACFSKCVVVSHCVIVRQTRSVVAVGGVNSNEPAVKSHCGDNATHCLSDTAVAVVLS